MAKMQVGGVFFVALACTFGFARAEEALDGSDGKQIIVHVGHLIAVPGEEVRHNVSIVLTGDRITAIENGYIDGRNVIDLSTKYVMPGLIDTHVHLTSLVDERDARGSLIKTYVSTKSSLVLRALPYAKSMLHAGFTTVRNLGDPAGVLYDLRDAINRGDVEGPRIFGVENQMLISGGDYDPILLKLRPEFEKSFDINGIADGSMGFRREVRREIARGADVIKVRISSTVANSSDGVIEYDDELRSIMDTAHRMGRRVAVHSHSLTGTLMALKAGADTIEHGPVTPDMYPYFKKAYYVPTLMAFHIYRDMQIKVLGKDIYEDVRKSVGVAFKAGVRIAFGSDAGAFEHSRAKEEFSLLVDAGLKPVDALRASTVVAAEALGKADQVGTIAPGKFADIVATEADPAADVTELTRVVFVMKGGRVFKGAAEIKN